MKSGKRVIHSFKLSWRDCSCLVKDYVHVKAVLEYTSSVKGPTLVTTEVDSYMALYMVL